MGTDQDSLLLTTPAPGFAAALNAQAAVSDQAWAAAQAACARHELRLAQALARLGLAAESDIAAALAVVRAMSWVRPRWASEPEI